MALHLAHQQWAGYTAAVLLTGLATLFRWALPGVLADTPYLAFYPAVVAAAAFGGRGPGIVATLGSLLCVDLLFDETPGWLALGDPVVIGRTLIFLGGGLGISLVAGMRRTAQGRLRRQAQELDGLVAVLDQVSEQRRLALDAAELGTWDYRFLTGEVFWDQRCRNMWGIGQGEQIGYEEAIARIHPDDRVGIEAAVREALAGVNDGAYDRQMRVVWPDGSVHWIASHGRVCFEGEGPQRRPVRFIGANHDITREKQAEHEMLESRERLSGIVGSAMDAIISIDASQRVVLFNAAAERMFGCPAADAMGGPLDRFIPQRFRTVHREHVRHFGESGTTSRDMGRLGALSGLRAGGEEFPIEASISQVEVGGHKIFTVIVRDITDRKRAEESLRHTAEELDRSNKDLEQFAYVASHDLQEPLRMVAGYMQLLAERYKSQLDEKADKFIDYAVDGARRMQTLIQDLLAFSRVNTRGEKPRTIGAEEALEQALRNLASAITENAAGVTHDPLPTVRADRTQLVQLFQNLVGNAVKYRSPDRAPRIHVSACQEQGEWLFSVKDNGIGFEQQYEHKMFLIFQRLHSRGKYPGTGIGLAICKRIVERHGGRLWAEGQPDQGATFYFTIPIAGGGA